MKRIILTLIALFGLCSCSTELRITFHKDATLSFISETNAENLLDFTGESLPTDKFSPDEISKTWVSLYERYQRKGNTIPKDSIDLYKRFFNKGVYKKDKLIGVALRGEHLSQKDLIDLDKKGSTGRSAYKEGLGNFFQWDGKKLVFRPDELLNLVQGKADSLEDDETDEPQHDEKPIDDKKESPYKKLFKMELKITFMFDKKIKFIQGKHPYLKQLNANNVQFFFDIMADPPKEANQQEIVIITK